MKLTALEHRNSERGLERACVDAASLTDTAGTAVSALIYVYAAKRSLGGLIRTLLHTQFTNSRRQLLNAAVVSVAALSGASDVWLPAT